jgi:hypothetical protein
MDGLTSVSGLGPLAFALPPIGSKPSLPNENHTIGAPTFDIVRDSLPDQCFFLTIAEADLGDLNDVHPAEKKDVGL